MSVSVWRHSVVLLYNIICCLARCCFPHLVDEGSIPSPDPDRAGIAQQVRATRPVAGSNPVPDLSG